MSERINRDGDGATGRFPTAERIQTDAAHKQPGGKSHQKRKKTKKENRLLVAESSVFQQKGAEISALLPPHLEQQQAE